jgi:hypothetical protein
MATFVRFALAALLIPSVSLAQPYRATATEILVAALRAVPVDSLCHHYSVIVVDTAIRGARNSYGIAARSICKSISRTGPMDTP